MSNAFVTLIRLLPKNPLQVGTVSSVTDSIKSIELPDGSFIKAHGTANVGDSVFVRNGVIEGLAPSLGVVEIEI